MFSRNQDGLPDDSLLSFRVLDQLTDIRADQSGDSLNERHRIMRGSADNQRKPKSVSVTSQS
jgi:hypothetical protein